jgi:hypothetical protein
VPSCPTFPRALTSRFWRWCCSLKLVASCICRFCRPSYVSKRSLTSSRTQE